MWQAMVAALAALSGVALGALLEPLKLRAARVARMRQERADRAARLIETAMNCRARLLSLNIIHRQVTAGAAPERVSEEDRLDAYRSARNDFRQSIALLELSGPDELAAAATRVHEAEAEFRAHRFALDDGELDIDRPPRIVVERMQELEKAVHEFARVARRYIG